MRRFMWSQDHIFYSWGSEGGGHDVLFVSGFVSQLSIEAAILQAMLTK